MLNGSPSQALTRQLPQRGSQGVPRAHNKKTPLRKKRSFWWGAQWDSNPRSPDPQSGALTDYAMGTTSMRPKGLEPPAHCLEGSCSIHLSYGRTLLSHWVPIWRQPCVGTRCEKYNTIPGPFCQEKFQNFSREFGIAISFAVLRLFLQHPHPEDAEGKAESRPGGDVLDIMHAR